MLISNNLRVRNLPKPSCSVQDRKAIHHLLHDSVNLQESAKFVGATGTGMGVIGAIMAWQVHPALSLVGVGFSGLCIYGAVHEWKESGKLLHQAVELNREKGCFTPAELNDYYHSIP